MAKRTPKSIKVPVAKTRAFGRSLKDFTDDKPLNRAEQTLIDCARKGEDAWIGDDIPKADDKDKAEKTIRAGLLRFLALGGDDQTPVHEHGVQVQGAVINGPLDFEGCTLAGDLNLWNCELTGTVTLRGARTRTVSLDGSGCKRIEADGANIGGGLHLRNGFVAKDPVRLLWAKIGGNLSCVGGRFEGRDEDGNALNCDGVEVRGGVFLRDGFAAHGAVNLLTAQIDGDLGCTDGTFGALPEDPAAKKDEKPSPKPKNKTEQRPPRPPEPTLISLIAARATVKGTLWLGASRDAAKFHGGVDLTGSRIGRIVDVVTDETKPRKPDPSPAGAGDRPAFLMLDGCAYDRFGEKTDLSAKARIAFLRLQIKSDLGKDFKPQPWTQMIKALREAGHTDAARMVAIEFEKHRRKAALSNSKNFRRTIAWRLYGLYGGLVGYGHRPLRLVAITLGMWLAFGIFYHIAAVQGVFAPSNPLVFQNSAYAQCSPEYDRFAEELPAKVGNWYWCKALPAEYTTFNPYLYSLDLILPLVDLQQDKDWAPAIPTPPERILDLFSPFGWHLSHFVRLVMWFEILFGWAASLLFVSVAAGFIKRMDSE